MKYVANNINGFVELSEEILKGMDRALLKLIKMRAANNQSLIVSDKEGNIKKVPAKELLRLAEE